jgi:hypothetical protein
MINREAELIDALEAVRNWCNAYPDPVFRPLSEHQVLLAGNVLEQKGISIGALHAMWARQLLGGIKVITEAALQEKDETP